MSNSVENKSKLRLSNPNLWTTPISVLKIICSWTGCTPVPPIFLLSQRIFMFASVSPPFFEDLPFLLLAPLGFTPLFGVGMLEFCDDPTDELRKVLHIRKTHFAFRAFFLLWFLFFKIGFTLVGALYV
ncbi:hypothetical protein GDO81_018455 [Engystomops pustulosus]|uniref:Uncharacterized protein n=1 Tax=Engystomops pustulosus TaxID=76066 RepID=A0AAV6ZPH9_ENGPU|nr:hypothetical protein GDO81_018455 [Engystomops pustulosus]